MTAITHQPQKIRRMTERTAPIVSFFHDAFRKAIKIRGDCPKEIEKELDPSAEPFV